MISSGADGSNGFILLSGTANPKLAKEIGKILHKVVFEPVTVFSDGLGIICMVAIHSFQKSKQKDLPIL